MVRVTSELTVRSGLTVVALSIVVSVVMVPPISAA